MSPAVGHQSSGSSSSAAPAPAGPPGGAVLEARGLRVAFAAGRRAPLIAVDGVDLTLAPTEALGLVGESGCGKTTVARVLAGLQAPTAGSVYLDGRELSRRRSQEDRRAIQMVFQDPTASLNPRMTVGTMLRELLAVHFDRHGDDADRRSRALLDLVGLASGTLERYPRELSGGQRQRVAIARALAVEPRVVVADEPTSALDVSVQATILRLFADLRAELGVGLILISHNLAATRALVDRADVMYLGRIVERGSRDTIFARPAHPYTRALLTSAPTLRPNEAATTPSLVLHGEPPSATRVPRGCRLHPRCPRAERRCHDDDPALLPVGHDSAHLSACHFRDDLDRPVAAPHPGSSHDQSATNPRTEEPDR